LSPDFSKRRVPKPGQVQGLGWLGLLVTLVFTLGYWRYSVADLERRESERFRQLAERQAAALTDRMLDYQRVLRGAAGLFAASNEVSREEWRRYVAHLDIESSLPGIQAIGFSAFLRQDQKAAHEQSIRAEGFPGFSIHPEGEREFYGSIVFIEPFSGRNIRAFGFDMYSEATRRAAMERARDTGQPALTRKVTLVQETERDVQPGFLMYLPIYRQDRSVSTLADRRASLVGWVYSPFRAVDLMEEGFQNFGGDTEVLIYDGPQARENLLYETPQAMRKAKQAVDFDLDLAGVRWNVRFKSSQTFEAATDRSLPTLILLSGLLVSLVIAAVLYLDARHRRRLEAQVLERTAELEKARDEAESASRAKTAFLATVSHELRTPLNAIIGFSSILLQDDVEAEQRKQLSIINRSGLQLLDLIKEILDITSIEAGHLSMQIEPVPLRRVLEEQCELLQAPARETGLYVTLLECDEALVASADQGRLSQVVRNLLSNAVKFTDRGGVTVRCRRDGQWARIEVEDTGIGISPEHHASLFVAFQRADKSRSNRPGTGLGLAISRRLVEAMGGEIGFESEVDRGSRFWFTVPLAAASAWQSTRPPR
jgi:signal transduction histidine kinase